MSKLVDKERLAKLAKALNDRMKAAVKAEETRALQAEARIEGKADQNAAAIAAINNEENGLLAQAKGYTNSAAAELDKKIQTKVSTSEYEAKVTELENKDKDMAADILGLDTAVKAIENKIGDGDLNLPAIDKAIKDFQEAQLKVDEKQNQDIVAAKEAADAAQADVDAVERRLDDEGGLVDRLEAVEEFKTNHSHEGLQSEIDALEGRADTLEQFVEAHSHEEIEGRLDDLEALFEGEESVDAKIEAVHDEVVALESKHDQAAQAQALKDQGQDEAIAAKVAKADYEVDKKALQDKDAELDQAIKDEAARADGVEKGLQQAIDDINNAEDGILAQAKAHAQGLVDGEKGLREQADTALDNRLQAVENSVGQGGTLEARVKANEDKLAGLEEGCTTVQAAIDKAEADAKAHAEAKIAELVDSAPEAMDTLNELAKAIGDNKDVYDSYVEQHAQAMAKQKEDLQAEIDADIATAVGVKAAEGVEATGLRKEIADAVKEEADRAKAEEAAIRSEFAAADTTLHTTISAEIDADVKAEADRAKNVEEGLQAAIDVLNGDEEGSVNKKVADAVQVEETRALAQEAAIRQEFAAEDTKLAGRISTLEGLVVGGEGEGIEAIIGDVAKNKEDIADLKEADITLQANIDAKVAQADYDTKVGELANADSALDNRIKVFEAGGAQDVAAKEVRLAAAEKDIDVLQQFMNGHDHKAMQDQIDLNEQGVADNKTAIEVLNGDATKEGSVAKSIADALAPYATEAETLAVIGQVVNSLALTMESNKMVLKLGGTNGVAINEVSLDMVTDADIEEIIEGLDDVNPTAFNF